MAKAEYTEESGLKVEASTQWQTIVQQALAHAFGIPANKSVDV